MLLTQPWRHGMFDSMPQQKLEQRLNTLSNATCEACIVLCIQRNRLYVCRQGVADDAIATRVTPSMTRNLKRT